MSQEKIAIENNKKEFKNSVIFQVARAEVEAMIKKLVQNAALQAEMIAKWSDVLAEQQAKANQEALDKLLQAMQAEIDQRLKAQPIEGLLPKQLKTADPIVVRVSQQLQQFQTLKEEFAVEREATVNRVADINNALIAMNVALAPVLAPSAPSPKPEERDDYVRKMKRVVDFGIELDSRHVKLNRHIEKMEDHSSAIDANLGLVSESSTDLPYLHSAAMEAHAYLVDINRDRDMLTATITLNSATYNDLTRIMESAFGMKMVPYSAALASNPYILLKSPSLSFGSCRDEREEEEKTSGLFSR